jgi:hypothetical protein
VSRLARVIWNLRFRLARAILPGSHKHIMTHLEEEMCGRCEWLFEEITRHNDADV